MLDAECLGFTALPPDNYENCTWLEADYRTKYNVKDVAAQVSAELVVEVPSGIVPGDTFKITHANVSYDIVCPPSTMPGSKVQVQIPAKKFVPPAMKKKKKKRQQKRKTTTTQNQVPSSSQTDGSVADIVTDNDTTADIAEVDSTNAVDATSDSDDDAVGDQWVGLDVECGGLFCSNHGIVTDKCIVEYVEVPSLREIAVDCHFVDKRVENMSNSLKRNLTYWWWAVNIYQIRGKGVRVEMPMCILAHTRTKYPAPDGHYSDDPPGNRSR